MSLETVPSEKAIASVAEMNEIFVAVFPAEVRRQTEFIREKRAAESTTVFDAHP